MGGKKDKSRGVAEGRHNEGVGDSGEKKTAWVSGTCSEGGWSGKRLSLRDDRGKESTGETEEEVHGRN